MLGSKQWELLSVNCFVLGMMIEVGGKTWNKIKTAPKRIKVYKTARTLLECLSKADFILLCDKFFGDLKEDEGTRAFAFYFETLG